MHIDIILIGPMAVGKSTQGQLLSEKLGIPRCPMDDLRWEYYKEIGYDKAVQDRIHEEEAFVGVYPLLEAVRDPHGGTPPLRTPGRPLRHRLRRGPLRL